MSMFDKRKSNEPEQPESAAEPAPRPSRFPDAVSGARDIAVIGNTITIQGDVTGDESLVIDGKVDGTVRLKDHDLTVGKSGLVAASVKAKVVRVEGKVTGDLEGTEKVVITKSGRVQGNIVAPAVTLEDGAKFKGSIDMDPGPAAATATPAPQPLKSVTDGEGGKISEASRPGGAPTGKANNA